MRALILVAALAATAHADVRSPRTFWLGSTTGIALGTEPSEFDDEYQTLDPHALVGVDIGFQRIAGPVALSVDGDLLPMPGIYRARGAVVLGHPFTSRYRLPCSAPSGYSCSKIFNYRSVRSIVGIKLGGEVGMSPEGQTTALEVGIAIRSQLTFDMSFMYDPVHQAPGGAMDVIAQFGPVYVGTELRGLASKDEPEVLLATFVLGYTPRMWKPHEP
jgi:hypothetical protein